MSTTTLNTADDLRNLADEVNHKKDAALMATARAQAGAAFAACELVAKEGGYTHDYVGPLSAMALGILTEEKKLGVVHKTVPNAKMPTYTITWGAKAATTGA